MEISRQPTFVAPISPWPQQRDQTSSPGQKIFDLASDLYAWYLWKIDNPQENKTLEYLNRILRIAKSAILGAFLSPKEAEDIATRLENIGRNLYSANLRMDEIAHDLNLTIQLLTQYNVKAKLIDQITELEYLHFRFDARIAPDVRDHSKELLLRIAGQVNAHLTDIQAQAVSRELSAIQAGLASSKQKQVIDALHILPKQLNELMKRWLRI